MDRAQNIRNLKAQAKDKHPKKKSPIRKVSLKRQAQIDQERAERGAEKTDLQKWYEHIMQTEVAVCWETGEAIDKRDKDAWHGSVAHVLSKALFHSVETHPMNYLILKKWGGTHGLYDGSWTSAMKMKVWPVALERMKALYPLLTQVEKRKLPGFVREQIECKKINKK